MKRYLCTVAAGFALALTSTATASADIGLPLPGQSGTQETNLGDQTVGEQRNDADVTQKQGNDNAAVSPAVGFGGGPRGDSCGSTCGKSPAPRSHGALTRNEQGNRNYASSDVDQENEVEQKQSAYQRQDLVEMCKGLIYR